MSFEVNLGPCGCCDECECPVVACGECESGFAAEFLNITFNDRFVWDFGTVMDMRPPPTGTESIFQPTGECEWSDCGTSAIADTPPMGLECRCNRLYFHAGSGTWRIDIDWVDCLGSYTPTDYLLTYELDTPYECCATEFTSTITRLSGPSGGKTLTTEPTEITIVGCGCCGPIQTSCCAEPVPAVLYATIDSACAEIDGMVVELPYLGNFTWEGTAETDCPTCHTVTISLVCSPEILEFDFDIVFSGSRDNPSPPPDTLECLALGQGAPCEKSLDFDCETFTGEGVYCLASLGEAPGSGSACCVADPTTITFAA